MATVLEIKQPVSTKVVRRKVEDFNSKSKGGKVFDAKKFTGKVKSFGDGIQYQKRLRDEG